MLTAELHKSTASEGLNRLFSYCEGFTAREDSACLDEAHSVHSGDRLCELDWPDGKAGWRRAALHDVLVNHVRQNTATLEVLQPAQVHEALNRYVRSERNRAGCLSHRRQRLRSNGSCETFLTWWECHWCYCS